MYLRKLLMHYTEVVSFNMKTIDVSSSFKLEEPDNYFTSVLSSNFNTFEDCIKHCTELTSDLDYGIVLLIVTKWSEIMDSPTHKTTYVCGKGECEYLTLEWEQCYNAYIREEVIFSNDWIEKYKVHENYRLCSTYREGCTKEESQLILDMYEKSTKPKEVKWKELKL